MFNASLMNDAILEFKRYEDASLTYTGIDKHADDEVGGWDTTIRKTQYEKLFYNQQTSMNSIDYSAYTTNNKSDENKHGERVKRGENQKEDSNVLTVRPVSPTPTVVSTQSLETETKTKVNLEVLAVGSKVKHKNFGDGEVIKLDKNAKFIHVKFTIGEKKFVFPDAFLMGFLEMK